MIRSTGFVTQANTPSSGWYKVSLSHAPQTEVSGVSLKNTAFTVGQQVIVFQYGSWGSGLNEFGFTEMPTDISSPLALRGQIQLIPSAFEFVQKNSPAQTCAAYIALANDNKKLRYFPATITAISGGFLRCKDYFEKDIGLIRLASGLSLSDFSVGDRVLINTFFNGTVEALGWWQTVPTNVSGYYIFYNSATLATQQGSQAAQGLYSLSAIDALISSSFNDVEDYLFFRNGEPRFLRVRNPLTETAKLFDKNLNMLSQIDLSGIVGAAYANDSNFGYAGFKPMCFLMTDQIVHVNVFFSDGLGNIVRGYIQISDSDEMEATGNLYEYRGIESRVTKIIFAYNEYKIFCGTDSNGIIDITADDFEVAGNPDATSIGIGIGSESDSDFYFLELSNGRGHDISVYSATTSTWYHYDFSGSDFYTVSLNEQCGSSSYWPHIIIFARNETTGYFVAFNKSAKTFSFLASKALSDFSSLPGSDLDYQRFNIKYYLGDAERIA